MIGLTLLALLGGLMYLAGKLTRFIAGLLDFELSLWFNALVFVLIVLLPFGDEIVGRIQFAHECRKAEYYEVNDAIKATRLARFDDDLAVRRALHAVIPIEVVTEVLVDANTGARLLTTSTLFTSGGWVMRAGLNMGTFSSCSPEGGSLQLMRKLGFSLIDGGYYERSGR